MVITTVAVLLILVKLGWWQLQRAQEKQHLQQQYEQRATQQLQWPLSEQHDLRGYQLEVQGRWLIEHSLLLDNQVLDGRVGYRFLVPLEINVDEPLLLVDLGFVRGDRDRRKLPPLPQLPQQSLVTGLITQPQPNRLADQLFPEQGSPTRIQALNWQQLAAHLQRPLVSGVLWLQQPQQLGFERRWQPLNMSADKHRGYALQWFGLALAWVVTVALVWRRRGSGQRVSLKAQQPQS